MDFELNVMTIFECVISLEIRKFLGKKRNLTKKKKEPPNETIESFEGAINVYQPP